MRQRARNNIANGGVGTPATVHFTGSISGTTLTASAVASGTVGDGLRLFARRNGITQKPPAPAAIARLPFAADVVI
jgi:hypothetical protein